MKGEVYAQHKFFNRRGALVRNAIQAVSRTPVPATGKTRKITTASSGHWQAALLITLTTGAISLCPSGAGAYTAGSADYGQVIGQLQQVADQVSLNTAQAQSSGTTLTGKSVWKDVHNNSVFVDTSGNLTAGDSVFTGPRGHSLFLDSNLNNIAYNESYLREIAGALGAVQQQGNPYDTANDQPLWNVFSSAWGFNGGSVSAPSAFQWAPGMTTTPSFSGTVTGNQAAQPGLPQNVWSVFNDQNGGSVFESPNGNSYIAYNPYAAAANLEGTGTAPKGYTTADTTSGGLPYSVFKDNNGFSVFSDYSPTGTNTGQSAFEASDLVMNPSSPNYGKNPAAGYGATESVFTFNGETTTTTGGTPIETIPGQDISVFKTDDPAIGNVDNSVFLDPWGNSYLDDMTAALTLPQTYYYASGEADIGAATTQQWQYTDSGTLYLASPYSTANPELTGKEPLTITQLLAASLGVYPTANIGYGNNTTYFGMPYPYLTADALQQFNAQSNSDWFTSGSWTNQFAYAFFNPPANVPVDSTLVPYLNALGVYNPASTTEQTMQATAAADWTTFGKNVPDNLDNQGMATNVNQDPWLPRAYPTNSDWQATGINYTNVTYPVLESLGQQQGGNVATEAQATACLYALYGAYANTYPTPPTNPTQETPSSYVDPAGLGNAGLAEQVPLSMAAAAINAAAWWQESMPWFINFFSIMWTIYCTIACFRWMNWGLHGGSFPLRVLTRSQEAPIMPTGQQTITGTDGGVIPTYEELGLKY